MLKCHYFVKELIIQNFKHGSKIVEVGAGAGRYGMMLNKWYCVDGIEIYEPSIKKNKLEQIYNEIYCADALEFDKYENYDVAILGDFLEHLTIDNAKKILKKLKKANVPTIVLIPFDSPRGEYEGNEYMTHLQPDLNEETMKKRYPSLKLGIKRAYFKGDGGELVVAVYHNILFPLV